MERSVLKKILFVIDSLECGGAEKALVTLLRNLDYSKYKVDLLYFSHENEYYKESIPKEVNIIDPDFSTQLALSSQKYVLNHLWNIRYLPLLVERIFFGIRGRIDTKNYFAYRVKNWKSLKKHIPYLNKEYDTAIAFLETNSTYYTLDKVKATRYIVWQHTDYKRTGCKAEWDLPYFVHANTICVVSEEMKNNFIKEFPSLQNKVVVFPNLFDTKDILEKAKERIEFEFYKGMCIISVGTLRTVKGYDVAMRACKRLVDAGYDFKWYVLGDGEEYRKMETEIRNMGLEDKFILLGNQVNPYAYIAKSDIFVQCSYREGYSTSVFEAKCLCKPIVITDAPGMRNQIVNNVSGIIAPIGDDREVSKAIERLIISKDVRQRFSKELEKQLRIYSENQCGKIELFDKITGQD